jgi:hypothetical protein
VRGSHLRSNMSRDVGTRKPFMLRWEGAPIDVHAVEGRYTSNRSARSLDLCFPRWPRPWLTRAARGPTLILDGKQETGPWDPWLWTLTAKVDGSVRVLILEEAGRSSRDLQTGTWTRTVRLRRLFGAEPPSAARNRDRAALLSLGEDVTGNRCSPRGEARGARPGRAPRPAHPRGWARICPRDMLLFSA